MLARPAHCAVHELHANRCVCNSFHEATTTLSIGSLEPTLSPTHPSRANRWIVATTSPRATRGQWTFVTVWIPRTTYHCAKIHQALVPRPCLPRHQRFVGSRLHLLRCQLHTSNPRVDTRDIGVDDSSVDLEREGHHRARRIRSDSGEREQAIERTRKRSHLINLLGSEVQIARSPRITKTEPLLEYLTKRRGGACRGSGKR